MEMENKTGKQSGKKGLIGFGLLLILALALVVCATSGAFGLLKDSTSGVTAEYTTATVYCKVLEVKDETDGSTIYSVQNTGNTDACFRAAVVINWVNEKNEVVCVPADLLGPKYSDDWISFTGAADAPEIYYYYSGTVAPGASVVFFTLMPADGSNGYQRQVTVIAEAIQAEPAAAAAEAWHHTYRNGGWTTP